ncbi:MAG: L-fucose/L-arabinose isomerase family protein [Armatimonadota bacterium]
MKLGFVSIAQRGFDWDWANEQFGRSKELLSGLGVPVVAPDGSVDTADAMAGVLDRFHSERVDAVVVQNGTFAWGGHIVNIAQGIDVPLFLWALPEPTIGGRLRSNSLCGVNMNASALYRLGRFYKYVYAPADSQAALDAVRSFVRVVDTAVRLRETRIALIGYRVPGFYGSTFDELGLRKQIGPEVHHIGMAEVARKMDALSDDEVNKTLAEYKERIGAEDIGDESMRTLARACAAMDALCKQYGCSALAVKCWPDARQALGTSVCSVMSKLTDDGLMAGCEADMYGTVTMLMQYYLTGKPPFLVDFVYADAEQDTGVMWHCGNAPFSLADDKSKVRISEWPRSFFGLKPGPFTFAKLGTDNGFRMLLTKGEALKSEMVFKGTTSVGKFRTPVMKLLDAIIYGGWEHHFSVVYEDVYPEMLDLCRLLGIRPVEV